MAVISTLILYSLLSRAVAAYSSTASTRAERPIRMTAALVPSAQLRMRVPTPLDHEGKRGSERRRQRIATTPAPRSSLPSSGIAAYYPWRRTHPLGRAATLLHAYPKEKSPYAEDAMDLSIEEEIVDLEMDSPLRRRVERGSNGTGLDQFANGATNGAANGATNGVAAEPSNNSLELWGIPVQSIILLNLVAVIWGTQHSVIKSVVDDSTIGLGAGFVEWMGKIGINFGALQSYDAATSGGGAGGDGASAYFTLARFGLAALLASPYTPGWRLWAESLKEKLRVAEPTTSVNGVNGVNGSGGDGMSRLQQAGGISSSRASEMKEKESVKLAWKYGAELGLYMFLGYAFQAVGLESTTATRSGILLYLNVKLVPFFSFFIFGKTIQRSTWISALVAFTGTGLLAFDDANAVGAGKGLEMALNVGDLWSIAAAAASAMFILRMEAASKAVPKSSELNAANLWTVAVLSFLWTVGISWNSVIGGQGNGEATVAAIQTLPLTFAHATRQTFQRAFSSIIEHPLALVYLSAVVTAATNFLQSKAQKNISAERASVIYAMDPVYGAIFANILLGETLGGVGLAGAFLIVVAAATNALSGFGGTSAEEEGGSKSKE